MGNMNETYRTDYRWRGGDLWNAPQGTIAAYATAHELRWDGHLGTGLWAQMYAPDGMPITVSENTIKQWAWNGIDHLGTVSTTTKETPITSIPIGCYIGSEHGIYGIELLTDLYSDFFPAWSETNDGMDTLALVHHSLHGDHDETIELVNGEQVSFVNACDIVSGDIYDELTNGLPCNAENFWYWSGGELFYGPDTESDEK